MAYFGYQNPPMAHFHGASHGNCALRYVAGVLVLRKFDFRGLKGQYDVKKANVRGLTAKIGYLRPILASRPHLWTIFLEYAIKIVP